MIKILKFFFIERLLIKLMVFAKHKSFRGTPKSSVTPKKTRNEVLTGQSKTASCCMPEMMYSTSLSVRYGASICL